jgi:hypothetical protein
MGVDAANFEPLEIITAVFSAHHLLPCRNQSTRGLVIVVAAMELALIFEIVHIDKDMVRKSDR